MTNVDELQAEIKRLTEELEHYMNKCEMLEIIVENNHRGSEAMHKIFMLQEAEIERLTNLP